MPGLNKDTFSRYGIPIYIAIIAFGRTILNIQWQIVLILAVLYIDNKISKSTIYYNGRDHASIVTILAQKIVETKEAFGAKFDPNLTDPVYPVPSFKGVHNHNWKNLDSLIPTYKNMSDQVGPSKGG